MRLYFDNTKQVILDLITKDTAENDKILGEL